METKFENPEFTESSIDDDSSSPAPVTPYLLFYSDVLKELNLKKDAVDIAKEAKERWSKMTPRSLQHYIEMASQSNEEQKDETEQPRPRNKNIRMENNSMLTVRQKSRAKVTAPTNKSQKRKRILKKTESKNILRSSYSMAKRPINDWDKMINWVTSSRVLRYKGKYAKSKSASCKRKKPGNMKKKTKASKCKNCCCKAVKGYCSCHKKKKGKSSSLVEKFQDDSGEDKRNIEMKDDEN